MHSKRSSCPGTVRCLRDRHAICSMCLHRLASCSYLLELEQFEIDHSYAPSWLRTTNLAVLFVGRKCSDAVYLYPTCLNQSFIWWLKRMCEVPKNESRDEMVILGFCRSGLWCYVILAWYQGLWSKLRADMVVAVGGSLTWSVGGVVGTAELWQGRLRWGKAGYN